MKKNEVNFENFSEISAIEEAGRCLSCKTRPCVGGCPANVDIPAFVAKVKIGDFFGAQEIIKHKNPFPSVCGRVCPQELQCEGSCVLKKVGKPIKIGALERFVGGFCAKNSQSDKKSAYTYKTAKKRQVAVIGSGPAGLSCAYYLAKSGSGVTIFEGRGLSGGMLAYALPDFRLPKDVLPREISRLKALGVRFENNMRLGCDATLQELLDDNFCAIFIATGASVSRKMGISGENLLGVLPANEFLERVNLCQAEKPAAQNVRLAKQKTRLEANETENEKEKIAQELSFSSLGRNELGVACFDNVIVVGGGNVAMDAARCAKRLGAKRVTVLYRRGENDMPARAVEVKHARTEGVKFEFFAKPVEVLPGENTTTVGSLRCVKTEPFKQAETGRRQVREVVDTDFILPADMVIFAIGTTPDVGIFASEGLELDDFGRILLKNGAETNLPHVYAGGDAVTGSNTVISAIAAGRDTAEQILGDIQ